MLQPLPINDFLADIQTALSRQNNLVLQAEPGAGKSTVVPLDLLRAPWLSNKKIIMLEPRRVAAKSIAYYLAQQLGEQVGQRVGYHVKNDRKVSHITQLEIITEGILTRRLQSDPELSGVGLIIFDEFHARSLQADLGLMLALEVQQSLRDDLKLLVMSATINTQLIAAYLANAAIIECPGRTFPVTVSYDHGDHKQLTERVSRALFQVLADDNQGDILVFLPGQADILRCLEMANKTWTEASKLLFLPLMGSLTIAQQEQAIRPDPQGRRRIIFTTNIAETSLTIEGVNYVIDSGLEKRLQYDPASGMTRLETVWISRASAEQRKGRAGRLQAGRCIRLWSEVKQASLVEYQPEEILTAELSSLVLELYAWGQTDYENIAWLTKPPLIHYQKAITLLQSLELISSSNALTELGQRVVTVGIEPRLAAMLLNCQNTVEQNIACDLAALLTEQDIFLGKRESDISERFMVLQDVKQDRKTALKNYPLKSYVIDQVLALSKSLSKTLSNFKACHLSLSDWQLSLSAILLRAYPDRLAKQRNNSNRYIMANGKGVFLAEDDALLGSQWLIVSDCDAQKREGKIYLASAIDQQQVKEILEQQFTQKHQYQLDAKKQKIVARQQLKFGAITVAETTLSDIAKEDFQRCLMDLLKTEGLTLLQWTARCEQWLARVEWLANYNTDFPQLSLSSLQDSITEWLLPYAQSINSLVELKKLDIYPLLIANLTWQQQQELDAEAPTHYTSPSGQSITISYDKHQGATVAIILQEMFGELTSPKLAYGQVPLKFELLSPARRMIQMTSDLAHFWQTSYFDVAKDMRAKYPKHRWPQEPLLAKPGRSFSK